MCTGRTSVDGPKGERQRVARNLVSRNGFGHRTNEIDRGLPSDFSVADRDIGAGPRQCRCRIANATPARVRATALSATRGGTILVQNVPGPPGPLP
jgi:hypothetical protein